MTRFALLVLLVLAAPASAQVPDTSAVMDMAEVAPELIGGLAALQGGIVYPESARRDGVDGRVMVAFVVDEAGMPTMIRIARGVRADLDSTAIEAVRNARFTPGIQFGRPVKVRFVLPVVFRLNTDEPAATPALGYPWQDSFSAAADSGAIVDGQGSVRVRLDGDGLTQVVFRVEDGILVETEVTVLPDTPQFERLQSIDAGLSSLPGVSRRADGYFHASDLTAAGQAFTTDFGTDLNAHTLRQRVPRCKTSSPHEGCVSIFPMLVGGSLGVAQRATYDRAVRQPIPEGRIVLSFTVDPEGHVVDAEVQSNSFGETLEGRTIAEGLIRSLRASEFVVDPGPQRPTEPVRFSLPFAFRTQE